MQNETQTQGNGMNTKIHNGFLIEEMGIHQLYVNLTEFSEAAKRIALEQGNKWLAQRATEIYDLRRAGLSDEITNNPPVMAAYLEMVNRHKRMRAEGGRDPEVDWSLEVSISPASDKRFIGIYHTEQEILSEKFLELPWVSEYAYYGETSRQRDERIAWETRAVEWNRFFANSFKPSSVAFSFKCTSNQDIYPSADLIDANVPHYEERCKRVATHALIREATAGAEGVEALYKTFDVMEQLENGAMGGSLGRRIADYSLNLADSVNYDALSHRCECGAPAVAA